MLTWPEHKAAYDTRRAQAIEKMTCFCACGCNLPVERLGFLGQPTICETCAHTEGHVATPDAAESYVLDEADIERGTAEAYIRNVGPSSGPSIRALYERLMAGKPLTEVMVTRALTAKAADAKTAVSTLAKAERITVETPPYIGPEVESGDYAVEVGKTLIQVTVERPDEGWLQGFVVVHIKAADEDAVVGVQYPQPWREVAGYRQTYRGALAGVVAALVSNPTLARERFEGVS